MSDARHYADDIAGASLYFRIFHVLGLAGSSRAIFMRLSASHFTMSPAATPASSPGA